MWPVFPDYLSVSYDYGGSKSVIKITRKEHKLSFHSQFIHEVYSVGISACDSHIRYQYPSKHTGDTQNKKKTP